MPSVPKGQCGFAGEITTALDMRQDELVHLELFFAWDGVSAWPNCHGTLTSLELRNDSDDDYEAVFDRTGMEGITGNPVVTFTVGAHSEQTIDNTVLGSLGLADLPDIGGVDLRQKTT